MLGELRDLRRQTEEVGVIRGVVPFEGLEEGGVLGGRLLLRFRSLSRGWGWRLEVVTHFEVLGGRVEDVEVDRE